MTLAIEDIRRIADLGHLELSDEEAVRMQGELNNIFQMIERIQAVDTEGVEPMPHPHDVHNACAKTSFEKSMIGKII